MIDSFEGNTPELGEKTYVHSTAVIIGNVTTGKGCFLLPYAVLRGDMASITLGDNVNVQDHTMIHTSTGTPTVVGNDVSIGHRAIIHGCTIGNNCIIGMGSIILDNATVGNNCLIAAGAVVTGHIPDNSIAMGVPAKAKPLDEKFYPKLSANAQDYIDLRERYSKEFPQ